MGLDSFGMRFGEGRRNRRQKGILISNHFSQYCLFPIRCEMSNDT